MITYFLNLIILFVPDNYFYVIKKIYNGHWHKPHYSSFVPLHISSKTKLKKNELLNDSMIIINDSFKWLVDKYKTQIINLFNDVNEINVTHKFKDGSPCRILLKSTSFLNQLEDELCKKYNLISHPSNGKSVYRLINKNKYPEPKDEWISEQWHIDNFDNNSFKIIVYLNDVNKYNAPFEYATPVQYIPKLNILERYFNTWKNNFNDNTRLNYKGQSIKAIGTAGTTIIFRNSNILHKGNYCKSGYRDVINFHFIQQ